MWTGRWPEPVLAVAAATMFVVAGAAHLIGYRHPAGIPAADPSTASNARKAVPKQAPPGCLTTQQVLDQAAQRHGLEPSLVEAVAWWESGWDQKAVSDAGAVGLMQVQPEVANELAPRLLGHPVDVHDPAQNAEIGAAILRAYIDDQGGDTSRGLAAYYEGPGALASDGGLDSGAQTYVEGVTALQRELKQGQPLPSSPPPAATSRSLHRGAEHKPC